MSEPKPAHVESSFPEGDECRLAALLALRVGLSVMPPREDGSKAPDGEWKRYQRERACEEQIDRWYSNGRAGVGIVCGAVSKNLEVMEFDDRRTYDEFKQVAVEVGLDAIVERIEAGYLEESPSGGIHWPYYCETITGNAKLACRPRASDEEDARHDKVRVLIETRGEGGFIIIAPSHGPVHPSGRPYRRVRGALDTITTLSTDEREALFSFARTFDRMPKEEFVDSRRRGHKEGERPGDVFARRTSWREILEPHGWTVVHEKDDVTYWRRPGKDIGVSATTNYGGSDLLFVFSTSTEFKAERGYGRFSVYTILDHAGDFEAAARALGERGYGEPGRSTSEKQTTDAILPAAPWPDAPAEIAFHGLAGETVRAIEPHTEADAIALLLQFLVAFGSVIGRTAHFVAEGAEHYANLFLVLVGATSKGRKGSSWGRIRRVFEAVDPEWTTSKVTSGLSSGEGLIWEVRDARDEQQPVKEKGKVTGYERVVVDEGVADKRLLVMEAEYSQVLRVLGREGNTLSTVMRCAWDTGSLQIITKHSPARATGAHIAIVGHSTKYELTRFLTSTECGNGFANRFLWACVRRSKVLPEGGAAWSAELDGLVPLVKQAVEFSRTVGEVNRDEGARELWSAIYGELSEGKPGLLGAMTARAEAQVMRLALLYALLDLLPEIRRVHIEAALALWRYVEDSAKFVFGAALGDPMADEILIALRRQPAGMTRTDIHALFGRHADASRVVAALRRLQEAGLVRSEEEPTEGRPRERWFALLPAAKEAKEAKEGTEAKGEETHSSPSSHDSQGTTPSPQGGSESGEVAF